MTVTEAGSQGGRARGLLNRGERNPKARLTWAAVATIRQERETRAVELARRYSVHPNRIWEIRRGAAWRQR